MHPLPVMTARFVVIALFAVLAAATGLARTQDSGELTAAANVNSRYVVEAIGVEPVGFDSLSTPLRDRIQTLVGARFDQQIFEEVTSLIRQEMTNWDVAMLVQRGTGPEHLRVTFEVKRKAQEVKLTVPRFVYHSRQNFSFGLDTGFRAGNHTVRAGVLTDNDELVERFSGVRGGYEFAAGSRVRFGADAGSWRSQWNRATGDAVAPESGSDVPGIYRTRSGFSPFVNFALLRHLTLQLGVSFDRLEMQYPTARHELSSAALGTLRFQRRWEVSSRTAELDASYSIRAGTGALGGEFAFNRHRWHGQASLRDGHHNWIASLDAGHLNGRAPLYERFVLGNSQTLRGWNRFDIAPFGASRMMHGSLEYRYRKFRAIYDTGSAWQPASGVRVRHSAAIGVTTGGTMQISALVAFPIRDGAVEPIFITGLYF